MALMKRRKTGRPRVETPMQHTGIVLPLDLLERLKNDARRSGHGLATEIRQRLQLSYEKEEEQARQPQLAAFIGHIKKLADSLYRDLGVEWYRTKFAREALKAGIAVFAGQYDTEDERVSDTRFTGYPDDAPPEAVGQVHARQILRAQDQTNNPIGSLER